MKVLQLTTHLDVGGITSYIVSLSKKLKRSGIDVICSSGGGYLVSELQKHGIRHVDIPIRTKNELSFKLLFSYLQLESLIREEKIDLIHAHTRVTQVVADKLRHSSKVRYVSTCHGFYKRRPLRRLNPSWGDRTIAVSEPVRETLVNDFNLPKHRIALIPNGVDTNEYAPRLTAWDKKNLRRYFQLKQEGFVAGSVLRLAEAKGLRYLVEAWPIVLDVFPSASLFLVGDGPDRAFFEKLILKCHLNSHIVLAGRQENIPIPLELMDIFVMASTSGEGFGMAVLEAMAAGKPVVATDTGSIYTLVKDGVNGFLVPPRDARLLAEKLIYLMRHTDTMAEMGRNGRQIATEHFSLDRVCEQTKALYAEVIKGA